MLGLSRGVLRDPVDRPRFLTNAGDPGMKDRSPKKENKREVVGAAAARWQQSSASARRALPPDEPVIDFHIYRYLFL